MPSETTVLSALQTGLLLAISMSFFTFSETEEWCHTFPQPVIDMVPDFGLIVKIYEPTPYIPVVFYAEFYSSPQWNTSDRVCLNPLNGTFF